MLITALHNRSVVPRDRKQLLTASLLSSIYSKIRDLDISLMLQDCQLSRAVNAQNINKRVITKRSEA